MITTVSHVDLREFFPRPVTFRERYWLETLDRDIEKCLYSILYHVQPLECELLIKDKDIADICELLSVKEQIIAILGRKFVFLLN